MIAKVGVNIQDEATKAKFAEIQSEFNFNTQLIDQSSMSRE